MKLIMIIIAIIGLIFAIPLMTIWSLNTLFSMSIAYTVNNWIAAWWLGLIVAGGSYATSGKK